MSWFVYLLTCGDGSLYCGATGDITGRLHEHQAGKGSRYTRSHLPVELLAFSAPMTKREALQLEYRVKQLPRKKKENALWQSHLDRWQFHLDRMQKGKA